MEIVSYQLHGVVPSSVSAGVEFRRLEMARHGASPLAIVWYAAPGGGEAGARLDLDKEAFLDDFGETGREALALAAHKISEFAYSVATSRHVVV